MKTVINTRIDSELKKQLQNMAGEMGLSLSALVSAALTKVARDKKLELSSSFLSAEEIRLSFSECNSSELSNASLEKIELSKQKSRNNFISL